MSFSSRVSEKQSKIEIFVRSLRFLDFNSLNTKQNSFKKKKKTEFLNVLKKKSGVLSDFFDENSGAKS
jgi:hypothetical protein